MKKRIPFYERTADCDIRYRGPLSYRYLRIAGWLCLMVAQLAFILNLAQMVNPKLNYSATMSILKGISNLSVPLFLIANFSEILTSQNKYKPMLIRYATLMLGTALLFIYFYEHIFGGIYTAYIGGDMEMKFEQFAPTILTSGYLSFNIFLDLFLCSVFIFFLDYTPTKVFTGKKIIIFRLFALLPVAYEVTSTVLKIEASIEKVLLIPYIYPFLTTKPPLSFLAFVILGLIMMGRKRKYIRHGHTMEEYHEFLKTNSNSLSFSIRMAIVFTVTAIVDLILSIFLSFVLASSNGITEEAMFKAATIVSRCGLGGSVNFVLLAPVLLLYSYNKKHKTALVDNGLPLLGIVGCALVIIEGLYRVVIMIPNMAVTNPALMNQMMETL